MFNVGKKSTYGRVGLLCLVVLGIGITSCQKEQVLPSPKQETKLEQPSDENIAPMDDDDEDHPPKDVNDGGRGK